MSNNKIDLSKKTFTYKQKRVSDLENELNNCKNCSYADVLGVALKLSLVKLAHKGNLTLILTGISLIGMLLEILLIILALIFKVNINWPLTVVALFSSMFLAIISINSDRLGYEYMKD
jgi:hypothetical protein